MAEEKNFENRIKTLLKNKGAWFIKYWGGTSNTGKNYTKSGVPDLLVCFKGVFIGIEVKATNGRPSDLQKYNLRQINAAGGFGFVLYPKHWEDFKKFIEHIELGELPENIKGDYPFTYEWDHK